MNDGGAWTRTCVRVALTHYTQRLKLCRADDTALVAKSGCHPFNGVAARAFSC